MCIWFVFPFVQSIKWNSGLCQRIPLKRTSKCHQTSSTPPSPRPPSALAPNPQLQPRRLSVFWFLVSLNGQLPLWQRQGEGQAGVPRCDTQLQDLWAIVKLRRVHNEGRLQSSINMQSLLLKRKRCATFDRQINAMICCCCCLVHSLHSPPFPCCVYSHKPINNKGVVN